MEKSLKRKNSKTELELYFEKENPERGSEGEEESETLSLSLSEDEEEEEEVVSIEKKPEKLPKEGGVTLSVDQKEALNHAKAGVNLFITGSAGTGKSVLIEQICRELRAMKKSVALTASTGLAAFQLGMGASTLHAFAGVGLGQDSAQKLFEHLQKRPTKLKLWRSTDVLIVDEFSMISADFFTKLDFIARRVRGCPKFFGGIQFISVGDYFQCPSVEKNPKPDQVRFPFLTPLWNNESRILAIALKTNFRQSGDLEFFHLLERIKLGDVKKGDVATLSTRLMENHPDINRDSLTKLCPTRKDVERINREAMEKIKSQTHTFKGDYIRYDSSGRPIIEKEVAEFEKKSDRYPADLFINLKVGVEVLLCCNQDMERGLVNGSRGRVIRFESPLGEDAGPYDKLYPLVLMENGEEFLATTHVWETKNEGVLVESFAQIPLMLRYAMTIHKAQGMTLGKVLVKCDFFENGQGYVALSRVRNLSDLYLEGLDMNKFTTHPDVIKFYKERRLLS